MYIVFDTETNGLPQDYKSPSKNVDNWPRIVEIAWAMFEDNGKLVSDHVHIIKPDGFVIPPEASKIHGITMEQAEAIGRPISAVLYEFIQDVDQCASMVGHNITFDINVIEAEIFRMNAAWVDPKPMRVDTMLIGVEVCKIPGKFSGYKWPKLEELYKFLFNEEIKDAHSSLGDVLSTSLCYMELKNRGKVK